MQCNVCGNDRNFLVTGEEFRILDTQNPEQLNNYFVPIRAICLQEGCANNQQDNNAVTFDPIFPALVPFQNYIDSLRQGSF